MYLTVFSVLPLVKEILLVIYCYITDYSKISSINNNKHLLFHTISEGQETRSGLVGSGSVMMFYSQDKARAAVSEDLTGAGEFAHSWLLSRDVISLSGDFLLGAAHITTWILPEPVILERVSMFLT